MSNPRFFTVATAALAAIFLLAGCNAAQTSVPLSTTNAEGPIFAELGMEGFDAREVVEALDAMPIAARPDGLITSIKAHEVTLTDSDGNTEQLPLPDDVVYISAAPYLSQTHDCYYHSPTSCVGELQNTDIDVTVTNVTTGEVVLDESLRTLDNGFVGLWIPRDIDASITVTYEDQSATSSISTSGDEVQTCVTTLQLT